MSLKTEDKVVSNKRHVLFAIFSLFVIWINIGCGGTRHIAAPPMESISGNSIEIWVEAGVILPMYHHENNYYLLGTAGQKYKICLGNRADTPVEVVVSVDGRDVVSGREADYRQDRGYVLLAREKTCIEGFRYSLSQVAAFEFSAPEQSYAAQMGDDSNVGVIGIAVFSGTTDNVIPPEVAEGQTTPNMPSQTRAQARDHDSDNPPSELGSSSSAPVSSEANTIVFKRTNAHHPIEIISFFYNDQAGLESMGIQVENASPSPIQKTTPKPFPAASRPIEVSTEPPHS